MGNDGARSFGNSLPLVGGVFESIWGSPEQEAKQRAMEEAKKAMFAYRPFAMDSRMNAMNNTAAAFGPMQQLMGQMYGQGAQTDMSKLIQNPFPQQMQEQMKQQAFQPEISSGLQDDLKKMPKEIRERVLAKQAEVTAQNRNKAGY